MKISISTNIFGRQVPAPAHFARAAAAGFDTLDFCAYYYVGQRDEGFYSHRWQEWIEGIRDMAADAGIRFNQTHNAVFNYFTPNETQKMNLECINRIIKATAMLGAKNTVCHPVRPEGENITREDCLKANREFFLRASDEAAKAGVIVCVENMKDDRFFDGSVLHRYCTNGDELIELVDSVNRENVKICVDVGHAHFMGESPDSMIRKAGQRLCALHVHDNDTWSDQHLLPFGGTVNWNDVTDALACVGYPGDFTFEAQYSFSRLPDEMFDNQLRYAKAVGDHLAGQVVQKKNL